MRRHRLYCPDLSEGANILSPEESHHAAKVLRLCVGGEVVLFDGAGGEAGGVITRVDRRRIDVETESITRRPFELSCKLTLGVAMSKAHRQAYLVEKCTELGVASIWPIITERGTSRPDASAVTRWSRRAIEAAKQSGRAWLPAIQPPMSLSECLTRVGEFDVACVTHPDETATPFLEVLDKHKGVKSMLALIGPEGGWSDEEQRQAAEAGAVPTKLGPTILRTETAAVAVCAAVAMRFDRA